MGDCSIGWYPEMITTERNNKNPEKNKYKKKTFTIMYVMCHWKVFIALHTM